MNELIKWEKEAFSQHVDIKKEKLKKGLKRSRYKRFYRSVKYIGQQMLFDQ